MSSNVTTRNDASGSGSAAVVRKVCSSSPVSGDEACRTKGFNLKALSQIAKSVLARQAVLRPVITICTCAPALRMTRPIFWIARSKSLGSFNRASSTESKSSQPSDPESSQLSNASSKSSSIASSQPRLTFSIRMKKAFFPSLRSWRVTFRISAVLPEPASDSSITR
ncbi:hypothetical protein ALP75_201562 [Pseudomonas syringae pv. actinidiae]|nr:hypothetical protein ALP75_201562 [Pseudomonas syringae pv. actinidiae]